MWRTYNSWNALLGDSSTEESEQKRSLNGECADFGWRTWSACLVTDAGSERVLPCIGVSGDFVGDPVNDDSTDPSVICKIYLNTLMKQMSS